MKCDTCGSLGYRTEYVPLIGHRTIGPCAACAGSGRVEGNLTTRVQSILQDWTGLRIPAALIKEHQTDKGLSLSVIADSFAIIERWNLHVDQILMHPVARDRFHDFDARVFNHRVPEEGDYFAWLWGAELYVKADMPKSLVIMMAERSLLAERDSSKCSVTFVDFKDLE